MVLRFIDGFDDYNTVANGLLKWTKMVNNGNVTIQNSTARNGNALKSTNASNGMGITLDNQATWIVGFAFQVSSFSNQIIILEFRDGGTVQCSLLLNTDGTLQVVRSTGTALDSSGKSSLALSQNTWYYIEWKVTISNSISAHTCKVNVNGTNWIDVNSGQNVRSTSNNQANEMFFLDSNITVNTFFDDLYIADGTTGTGNYVNDLIGDVRVENLTPNADGNYSQWSLDTGSTHNTRVNETNPDTTSYAQTSTVNNIDSYAFTDLSSTPTTIYGIQVNNWAEKTDTAARTFANLIRISNTDYVNSNNLSPTNGSYLDLRQIYENDPSTGAAWGATNVNAMEVGVKLTG